MPRPANLVHQTTTTTGTGPYTLTAEFGKQSFNTAFGTGGTDTFDVFISNREALEWVRGTGHLSAANTLVIDTVAEGTNGASAVNFSAGTKDVTNDIPALNQAHTGLTQTWTAAQLFRGGINPLTLSGDLSSGSAVVPNISSTSLISAGNYILGVGVPEGVTVNSVDSATQITMSSPATASGTKSLQFGTANPLTQYFFGGGVDALMSRNDTRITSSATLPEIGQQFVMEAKHGSANSASAYKVGVSVGLDVDSNNSANGYIRNDIMNIRGTSSTWFGTGYEININTPASIAYSRTSIGTSSAVYGMTVTAAGAGTLSSMYWAIALNSNGAAAGYTVSGTLAANSIGFYDSSNSTSVMQSLSTHTFGVNFFSATFGGGLGTAFISPNNVGFGSANAAGSATIPLIYLNGSNVSVYGSTSVIGHNFLGNPGTSSAFATFTNSRATVGDAGITLAVGANAANDGSSTYIFFTQADGTEIAGSIARADAASIRRVVYNTTSDARLKVSLGLLDDAVERLKKIKVHKYRGKGYEGAETSVGFFAQELYEAYPWAVTPSDSDDPHTKPWQVDYGTVTPLLVAALQDALKRIEDLERRLSP